jgi:hypothetical protein
MTPDAPGRPTARARTFAMFTLGTALTKSHPEENP